jgi:hypothetical protein
MYSVFIENVAQEIIRFYRTGNFAADLTKFFGYYPETV